MARPISVGVRCAAALLSGSLTLFLPLSTTPALAGGVEARPAAPLPDVLGPVVDLVEGLLPSAEAQFVGLINDLRASRGLARLAVHPLLEAKARAWAATMAEQGRIWHSVVSDGITVEWSRLGENVGMGPSVGELHEAFVRSPHHYENLVHPDFTHLGIGVVTSGGTLYVAEEFMTLRSSAPPPPVTVPPTTVAPAAVASTAATPPPTTAPPATRPPSTRPPTTRPPQTVPATTATTSPPTTVVPVTEPPVTAPPETVPELPPPTVVSPPLPPSAGVVGATSPDATADSFAIRRIASSSPDEPVDPWTALAVVALPLLLGTALLAVRRSRSASPSPW